MKADNNYVAIFTETNDYRMRKTLQEVLNELAPEPFMQVHRSYAINKNKITELAYRKLFLDDIEIPVSRKYYSEIKGLLKNK